MVIFVPAMWLNTRPESSISDPGPAVPKLSALGWALARVINSLMVFAGTSGCASSTCGLPLSPAMKAKSFSGSYGVFESSGAITKGPATAISIV